MSHPDLELVRRAIARHEPSCRALVARLSPVIQRRVNATLIRAGQASRQDVRDLVQEVFGWLLEEDARILRSWRPDGGASLEGFVGLVAERRVVSFLSSGRRSGRSEDATDHTTLDIQPDDAASPESRSIARDKLGKLVERLQASLSDEGYQMFVLLFVEQREVSWVMEHRGLSRDAVYAWRSRLAKRCRQLSEDGMSDPRSSKRTGLTRGQP